MAKGFVGYMAGEEKNGGSAAVLIAISARDAPSFIGYYTEKLGDA